MTLRVTAMPETPTGVQFDRLVAWFRSYENEAALLRDVFSQAKGTTAPVVELGVGTGNLLQCMVGDASLQLVGIDCNHEMIDIARARVRGRARLVEGDVVCELRQMSNVRAIYAPFSFVFNFVSRPELHALIDACSAALVPGGVLALNGFSIDNTIAQFGAAGYHSYGVNPAEPDARATFVRVVRQPPLVTLIFYHRERWLAQPVIARYTLKPYDPARLISVGRQFGLEPRALLDNPRGGAFDPVSSTEFWLVMAKP